MKLLIVSTSTIHGKPYLSYLQEECQDFFKECTNILFIPFARPGGISHEEYTAKARAVFATWGLTLKGAEEFKNPEEASQWCHAYFIGGGNTFVLADALRKTGYFKVIDRDVRSGKPYMGTSAGCNMAGLTIGTTNDMPIVYPPSFDAFGWVPFNINPHYLDPIEGSTHMGETRETRIAEFHHFNNQPVIGLREGSWIRVENSSINLRGNLKCLVFMRGHSPKDVNNIAHL